MNDPNLPEGVKQRDIDRTCGETFDPNEPDDPAGFCEQEREESHARLIAAAPCLLGACKKAL